MKTIWILGSILGSYAGLLGLMYALQSKLIFIPSQLPIDHIFSFSHPFREHFIDVHNARLHALSFEQTKTKIKPKGLILYFHGNAGCLDSWGDVYRYFMPHGYDSFIVDYRGYGKSTGTIESETQLFDDANLVFEYIQKTFGNTYNNNIILYGRSIGTGIASRLAVEHNPKMLILETPYYNLPALVRDIYPFVPQKMVRFKLSNNEYIQNTAYPVHIFHGTKDEIIPYEHGKKLSSLDPNITLHTINDANHNNIPAHQQYHQILEDILKEDP